MQWKDFDALLEVLLDEEEALFENVFHAAQIIVKIVGNHPWFTGIVVSNFLVSLFLPLIGTYFMSTLIYTLLFQPQFFVAVSSVEVQSQNTTETSKF